MAEEGPLNSGTCVEVPHGSGTIIWSNEAFAEGPIDGNWAGTSVGSSNAQTHYLQATNFGFAIPAGATIDGIMVSMFRRRSGPSAIDSDVRIVKGGVLGTTNLSVGASWPAFGSPSLDSFGGPTEMWGETWTAADINAVGFGAAVAGILNSSSTLQVDSWEITVFFTLGGEPGIGPTQEMLDLANAEGAAMASLCTPLFACLQGTTITNPIGGTPWGAPDRADACDENAAQVVLASGAFSDWLQMSLLGFAIPLTATVRGIMVSVTRRATEVPGEPLVAPRMIVDSRIQLTKDGVVPTGENKSLAGGWPSAFEMQNYGFTQDLWGNTWTPAEINAGTFGIILQCGAVGGGIDLLAEVDCFTICVFYDDQGV